MPYFPATASHSGGGGDGWSPHCIIHSDTGSTVTAVKGSTTVTAEETSEGIFELDLPGNDYGDWTFNGVVDGSAMHLTTEIKVVQKYEINFINGRTALPIDDVTIFLECAAIYDSEITTLADLLADTELFATVIASENAVNYLVRCTGWQSTICGNQTIMSIIGLNNMASNALLADVSGWRVAICNSSYYESILNVKVPLMTSATTPEGQVFDSGYYSSPGYGAFGGGYWFPSLGTAPCYDGYVFTREVTIYRLSCIIKVTHVEDQSYPKPAMDFYFQIYDAATSQWVNIASDYTQAVTKAQVPNTQSFNKVANSSTKRTDRCRFLSNAAQCVNQRYNTNINLQFYGRVDV